MTVDVVMRPQQEYDDMAFMLMCIERNLLRKIRRHADLSQAKLAEMVGTGVRRLDIHRWETHYVRPSLKDLSRIAQYGAVLRQLVQETGYVIEK